MSSPDDGSPPAFDRNRHVRYFAYHLRNLPSQYCKLDTNRVTLVHFSIQALDILGVLDSDELCDVSHIDKHSIIEWIYSLQVTTSKDDHPNRGGFQGGSYLGSSDCDNPENDIHEYSFGHLAMTYSALCSLVALGDDLSRVNKVAIIDCLKVLQQDDGSFQAVAIGSECDARFLYCACCISHMLDDWSGVDTNKAVDFIKSCRGYDGGIALIAGQEGHGGSTFCATAALALMGRLDQVLDEDDWRAQLIHWCVHRQVSGMQGRPNKAEDTCYSYWIGGTLCLLEKEHLLDQDRLRNYVLSCQHPLGGFGKVLGAYPDVLHAFYSLAWTSISSNKNYGNDLELKELNVTLGICQDRAALFKVKSR
jgi:geranylgeranyl transferase type-1 subunit beta